MMICFERLDFKKSRKIRIEDPSRITLDQIVCRMGIPADRNLVFYSHTEQGFLRSDLPLSQIPAADGDRILLIELYQSLSDLPKDQKRQIGSKKEIHNKE